MASLSFEKWHGTGNDFILIDENDIGKLDLGEDRIRLLCDRHFGIGADGLMLLSALDKDAISMKYFNSDGRPGSMCGNGGRCAVNFAHSKNWMKSKARMLAPDGWHRAERSEDGTVRLQMQDTALPGSVLNGNFLDTGSPHYVEEVDDLIRLDVGVIGHSLRHHEQFRPEGTNVNFYSVSDDRISMRTFERGVEAETLSCGTGTVAVALCVAEKRGIDEDELQVAAPGGELSVAFKRTSDGFEQVVLSGPAHFVFRGSWPFDED